MPNPSSTIEQFSRFGFAETLSRLTSSVESAGMTVFAQVDHSASARTAGLSLPPTVVILYGHPKGGTPVMAAVPLTALDLPLKVLVRERPDGKVVIAWHPISQILGDAGVDGALITPLAAAQIRPFEGMAT